MNVASLLGGPLASSRDSPALIAGSAASPRVTTFWQLDVMSRQIAARLHRGGLTADGHVVLMVTPSAMLYAALIAVFRLGAIAVFVEPSAGNRTLDAACSLVRPHAFIGIPKAHLLRLTSGALRGTPRAYTTAGWLPLTTSLRAADMVPVDVPLVVRRDDDPALLTFTSGSTGPPKGAIRTHGILRAQLEALTHAFPASLDDVELVSLPIVTLVNLANGVATVLPDADSRNPGNLDPAPVIAQVAQHRVARITASPAFLERLVDAPRAGEALESVHTIITGGGPVFPDLVSRLARAAPQARVVSVYGSTEAEPIAHITHDEVTEADARAMARGRGLLAGPVDRIAEVAILPSTDQSIAPRSREEFLALVVAPGTPGEIVVTGPHVVPGYVRGVGDSETKIRVGDTIWHRTGDLGYLDDTGRLWLLGRASAVVTDQHGVMYPFAVETAVRATVGPVRVAALSVDGSRVLVAERDASVSVEALRASVAWADVQEVRLVDRIPMDRRHNSKVDYGRLRALLQRR
jgi:olefin beta-lactone synthetase